MDLRDLNLHIVYKKFRMTSIQGTLPLLSKGVWMVTLDLKDAYFHITIALEHRKYLRFTLGDDHYQFKALPFGITSAPRVFTKTMAVVISYLHTRGIMIFLYLDYWLIVADSMATVSMNLEITLTLLHSLGIQVNWNKSHLEPTQHIQFIGAVLDSLHTHAFLPIDCAQSLWHHVEQVLTNCKTTALQVQQLLGHMAAAIADVPFAKLHMRPLQMSFQCQFRPQIHSQSRRIFLKRGIKESLTWWTLPANILAGTLFRKPDTTITLTTDASLTKWGAHLGKWTTRGLWSHKEARMHINWLELQCNLYCTSGGHDPRSLGDGLLLDWSTELLYMFPPLPLIPRVLRKLQDQNSRAILIAPWWLRRNWFPFLLQMSKKTYIRFPQEPDLLILLPHNIRHHDVPSLALMAWHIDLQHSLGE